MAMSATAASAEMTCMGLTTPRIGGPAYTASRMTKIVMLKALLPNRFPTARS
jgi:hypothetical protein